MANTIKHKRGSGSNPSANDLVAGEIAIRTDTGVLFIKKDDNSVASISGGSTNLGVSTTSSAVTVTSSTGDNATISEATGSAAGVMSTAHHDKLDGIEANATADQSASEILTAIKTVDGSGSGLDADLLDGVQGSSFLRSDAADTKTSGDLSFSDSVKAVFGGGSDLQIYHDGNNSFIKDAGTGRLSIVTSQLQVTNAADSEVMIKATQDGAVELYHNGAKKLETSSSGISVTGNVVVSGTVDGRDVASDGSKLDGIEANATADQTAAEIRTLVESASDSNVFTDADHTKLNGIATGATANSTESIQDIVGGMVSGNTESGITVTYQDGDGTLDFSVASQTDNNFTTTLKNKLDGIAAGATNVTNNNQLTNGAGYITATLTNEQVQDIVGGMLSGNTESGITVTYQDGDGTIDFSVASQTDNNFTTTLKNKLDGIASGAQVNVATNLSKTTTSTTNVIASSTGTNVTLNEATGSAAGLMSTTHHNKLDGIASGATANSTESIQDIVGAMVSSNTESGITVTYQDGDGTLDFSVTSQTDNNFTTTLKNKLDGIASGATNVTNNNQLTNGAGYITSADGGNAATLDGIDSSQFLRSDAADTKTSGNLTFNDNIKLQLGSSSDLQIYHNGSNSFIDDAGTGGLYLRSNQTQISKYTGETCAKFSADGSVELYYDNSLKVNTTSSGIDVSGIVDIDSHIRHNGDGNTYFGFNGNDQINFYTSGSHRFQIDSSGHFYFGQFSTSIPGLGNTTLGASYEKLGSGGAFFSSRSDGPGHFVNRNNNGDVMQFYRSGNGKGSISVNNSNTQFNTSSDYRLKENIVDLTGAITRVKQLQPKRFNFIADPGATQDGFLAHEAATVLPWAVNGTHNQVQLWGDYETDELPEGVSLGDPKLDDDGNTIPVMQGMDYGKVTPLLTAALQEAIAKIETLETQNADLLARVTALEGS